MQFEGDASRVVYCKAWILGCCALQLMAFHAPSDGAAAADGTQAIVRNLLESSDDRGHLMHGAVPGESRLRGTLVSCLGSLASVGSIDLGRSWREQKVCACHSALGHSACEAAAASALGHAAAWHTAGGLMPLHLARALINIESAGCCCIRAQCWEVMMTP